MAKDPNYDRYAGMVSLPGADGKLPRPFRVDEDGNVIYRDEDRRDIKVTASRNPDALAKAGVLDWEELDRKAAEDRLAKLAGEGAEPLVELPRFLSDKVTGTRKRIGGVDYNVIGATTFEPSRSTGVTSMPNDDMMSVAIANRNQVTPKYGAKAEKGGFVISLPLDFSAEKDDRPASEKNLPLTNPKPVMNYFLPIINPNTGSTDEADTLNFGGPDKWPIGTVGLSHGHIDGRSDGMVDYFDPKDPKSYGDSGSSVSSRPTPQATVSRGHVGWHFIENGQLKFMYPVAAEMKKAQLRRLQENLDKSQTRYQERRK